MSEVYEPEQAIQEKRRALLEALLRERDAAVVGNGKIPRRRERGHVPLAFAQERLWFLDQYYPPTPLYNIPVAIPLYGQLDVDVSRAALNELVRRHESLRTTFAVSDGQPVQVIAPEIRLEAPLIDLTDMPEDERQQAAARMLDEEGKRTFNLAEGPLLRASFLRLWDQVHILALTMHHIVSDGWSMSIFISEFNLLYRAFLQGQPSPLPELPIQYADFAVWQRRWLQGSELEAQLAYWKEHLGGVASDVIELPIDYPRPASLTFKGGTISFLLPTRTSERIRALTQEAGVTPFITLLACFKALLFRYTGKPSVVVGIPTANRNRTEIESLIGFFVNTLVVHTEVSADLGFRQLLARVREVTLGAYAHQDLPFEKLVEELQPTRSANVNPLFQVMFDFQLQSPVGGAAQQPQQPAPHTAEGDGAHADDGGILSANPDTTSKFDLSLMMMESGRQFGGTFEYSTELFDHATVVRTVGHFQTLVEAMAERPDEPLGLLPLLPADERSRVLDEWNNTRVSFPEDLCAHELFEAQAAASPDAVAATFEQQQITYGELNRRANRLARYLRGSGAGPETVIAICMESSIEMLVAIMGVLKAGGAYLPLDPAYPRERLAFMLDDARVGLVLTQERLRGKVEGLREATLLPLDAGEEWLREFGDENLPVATVPRNACYVIYTSGSTGRPKGIVVEHRSLVNLFVALKRVFNVGPGSRVLQFASFSFDQSVREVFETLLGGATLCLARREELMPGEPLLRALRDNRITDVTLVPSIQSYLPDAELPALRSITAGGEVCAESLVNRWGRGRMFVNAYGPSEITFASSLTVCRPGGGKPTIGAPLANVRCYVLDSRLEPRPVGAAGELLVGGEGVARGYLGRPSLTAERFVPDPFSAEPGGRLYRTGDLARWLPTGELDYLGRIDQQVKVRGFRIELGEVESALAEHPSVAASAVQACDDLLVAYVVAESGERGEAELRAHLSARLPEYMVPQLIVYLEAMPVTPAGKVDRRALPPPSAAGRRHGYEGPRSEAERAMAEIWGEVFGVERVGVHDNFFEMGGHSLLVTQIVSRVRDTLNVEMPIRKMFEMPTVAELALWLEQETHFGEAADAAARAPGGHGENGFSSARPDAGDGEAPGVTFADLHTPSQPEPDGEAASKGSNRHQSYGRITRRRQSGAAPLSFAQERLWILDQIQPGSNAYNVFRPFYLAGDVDARALERSINELVQRHEILRTTFRMEQGRPVQVIEPAPHIGLVVKDLSHLPTGEKRARMWGFIEDEILPPYDLSKGPLLRTALLKLGPEEHLLALCMHHIIGDEWSIKIFLRELMALYEANRVGRPASLPPLPVQYADFAAWQREWMRGEVLEEHLSFWRRQLSGLPAVLELPFDHPRPAVESFRGAMEPFALPQRVSAALEKFSRQENATAFMTLLAAYMALLQRYTGQRKIVVGAPIANRNRAEVENLIGFFTNTLVLHADFDGDPTFRQLVRQVREMTLGAYAHEDMPFERLVEELNPERNLSVNPLFQVMFVLQKGSGVFQGLSDGSSAAGQLNDEPVATAKFDLTLYMEETSQDLAGGVEYATELFERETVRRLIDHFETLLEAVSADPDMPLSRVNLLGDAEQRRLLTEWGVSRADFDDAPCVHALVEAQAARTPDATALAAGGKEMTYRGLNETADALARQLRRAGVGPEVSVGVYMERSPELAVALLAVLKSGGVYAPLNPNLPPERLAFMAADARVRVILTRPSLADKLPATDAVTVLFGEGAEPPRDACGGERIAQPHPQNASYIIYTSGSTGAPKGVVLPHRTLSGLISWQLSDPRLSGPRRTLQFSSPSFDVSLQEILTTWCSGGALVCAEEDVRRDFHLLARFITDEKVERLFLPYVALQQLAEVASASDDGDCRALREVITAGEQLKVSPAIAAFFGRLRGRRLFNQYGPSESHVVSEYRLGDEPGMWERLPPIGVPVAGARLYILGAPGQLAPTGVASELYIGGPCVGRGYLNRPGLTAEKFLPDPFCETPGARMYRTGDVVRHRADGNLEFLGRADQQLKIRGFRVEPGEVESSLVRHIAVAEAAVVARPDASGGTRLVAYVIPAGGGRPSAQDLRAFLRESLPDYMMPSQFVFLDELPLTESGKVDRLGLPEPDHSRPDLEESFVAPRSALEEQVAAVWSEVLGVDKPGIYDNFFELGGHSLLATQMVSRLREHFAVEIPVRRLFQSPTIADLALVVVQTRAEQSDAQEIADFLRELEGLSGD